MKALLALMLLAIVVGPVTAPAARPTVNGPLLLYSTYLGGNADDWGRGVAVDGAGNVYVTGWTWSPDLPLLNPLQPALNGPQDAFVAKFSPAGALIYSTYLGGSGNDRALSIAVDGAGNAYVSGNTNSTDFPLRNPFQATYGGGFNDAFAVKLSPDGAALVYSTYLGGSGSDFGIGNAIDGAGSAHLTGITDSTNFPLQNPFQSANPGGGTFVTKLSASGSALVYSTYLGGAGGDTARSVTVDGAGSAYVLGWTNSTDFPLQNPFQPTYGGGVWDAFVTKFNPAGTALAYSTYLGGSGADFGGDGLVVDGAGNATVTGATQSTNFPTHNPFQPAFGGGTQDAFVTKLSASGLALVYSTYLGGSGDEWALDAALDSAGRLSVSGETGSPNFPLQSPLQSAYGGGSSDGFLTQFNAASSALLFSTYFGGGGQDQARSVALDNAGNANFTGITASTDFPLRSPIRPAYAGGAHDGYVARISLLNLVYQNLLPAVLHNTIP
jgi:hypothetical protein